MSKKLAIARHNAKSSRQGLKLACLSNKGAISESASKWLAAKRIKGNKACCTCSVNTLLTSVNSSTIKCCNTHSMLASDSVSGWPCNSWAFLIH